MKNVSFTLPFVPVNYVERRRSETESLEIIETQWISYIYANVTINLKHHMHVYTFYALDEMHLPIISILIIAVAAHSRQKPLTCGLLVIHNKLSNLKIKLKKKINEIKYDKFTYTENNFHRKV